MQACWKQDKIDEAVIIIEDMESRGIVGTASVYYEFACCLCSAGRTREALLQVLFLIIIFTGQHITYLMLKVECMDSISV